MAKNIPTEKMYEKILEWLITYHSSKDIIEKERLKTRIVLKMYPVVRNIARTIARRANDPIEDMVQAGFIGLLKAIDNFNVAQNDNFSVYAGYLIIGEMKHYLRDKLNAIRVPRHIHELSIRISNFTKDLTDSEVNSLTTEEMASALHASCEAVDAAMLVERRRNTISLNDVYDSTAGSLNYEEIITDEDYAERILYEDARIMFNDAISKLPEAHRLLIQMYYRQDMSLPDIARYMDSTVSAVSRRLKRALDNMADIIIENKIKQEEGSN